MPDCETDHISKNAYLGQVVSYDLATLCAGGGRAVVSKESGTAPIRVSAAPINWGVTRLDPDNPPVDEMLDAIVATGYEGCELGPLGYLATDPTDIDTRFRSRGLALVAAFVAVDLGQPLPEAFLTDLESVAILLDAGDAKSLLLSDDGSEARAAVSGAVEQHPETWWSDQEWQQLRANVETVIAKARAHGLQVAFHPHAATHVESGREISRLLEETKGLDLRFCLDTGHILIGGTNPVEVLDWVGDRVTIIHVKDVDGDVLARIRSGDLDYFGAVDEGLYCDLGDGAVDWGGIAAGLKRFAFTGWVVVEQDRRLTPGDSRPVASLRRNREFVRQLLNA
jgi:inosose dehydratase